MENRDQVQFLCHQLLDAQGPEEIESISSELRTAIHELIEDLRKKIVPVVLPLTG